MAERLIELRNVSKSYGNVFAVGGVNLHVDRGEVVGLLGVNGAGKPTTIGKLTRYLADADQKVLLAAAAHAARLAAAVLAGYGGRRPPDVGGGLRARVSVLRALLAEPRALLLDEPFSRLDAALRDRFRTFVYGRIRALGIPAVLVTHDPVLAARMADRTLRVGQRAGAALKF